MRAGRVLLLLLALAGGAGLALLSLHSKYTGFSGEVFVEIPRGTSTRQVARLLSEAGVVRASWQFVLARSLRPRAVIQAGEYRFDKPGSAWEVFDRMARGDVFYHELVVPEGHNLFDIASALERLGIMPAERFLDAARDAALIRDLDPQAPSLEGYLFPDTYRFPRRATAIELCRQMTDRFRHVWASLGAPAGVRDTVTLASLVEKETALVRERPLVASVFVNRLRLQMPLQCDPTTIYAALLEDRYRGEIYQSDLASKQRYNTYQHTGLPPGPIANPGLESLKSALAPAETDYIYFVALPDSSGGHQFSTGLAAHQRAVAKYRRGLNQTLQTGRAGRVPGRNAAGQHH